MSIGKFNVLRTRHSESDGYGYFCRSCQKKSLSKDQPGEISAMDNEASYICDACGEEIVIPIDPTAGTNQEYVEDCPVCCHPCVIHVVLNRDGDATVAAQPEQDRL